MTGRHAPGTGQPHRAAGEGAYPDLTGEEQAQLDYIKVLAQAERDGQQAAFRIGPWSLITMIAAVQFAMRHPAFSPDLARVLTDQIRQMAVVFDGTMGADIVAAGFDPSRDYAMATEPDVAFDAWLADRYPDRPELLHGGFDADDMAAAFDAGVSYAERNPANGPSVSG